jgi:hypothetical protein
MEEYKIMKSDKFKDRFVHHRNLLGRGAIELGAVLGATWTANALVVSFGIPKKFTLLMFFGLLVVEYLIGWFYYKSKLIEKDYGWHQANTPQIKTIIESIYMTYQRVAEAEKKINEKR